MSQPTYDEKVKEVVVDNDVLFIELLNGLRLAGPMRARPVPSEPVVVPGDGASGMATPLPAA
jgi:hypothetical protein